VHDVVAIAFDGTRGNAQRQRDFLVVLSFRQQRYDLYSRAVRGEPGNELWPPPSSAPASTKFCAIVNAGRPVTNTKAVTG
jgi:hypothetical protein